MRFLDMHCGWGWGSSGRCGPAGSFCPFGAAHGRLQGPERDDNRDRKWNEDCRGNQHDFTTGHSSLPCGMRYDARGRRSTTLQSMPEASTAAIDIREYVRRLLPEHRWTGSATVCRYRVTKMP